MNGNQNYIRLKELDNQKYEIVVNLDGNRIKLDAKEAKIMYLVLMEFPYHQINKNTFLYPDCMKILATYNKLNKKHTKPKKVNRTKSKNVLVSTITAGVILSLAISGASIYQGHKNEQQQEKMIEIMNNNSKNLEKLTQELLNNNINIELQQEEITEVENYIENFSYYFEEIGDKEALENANQYEAIFKKYEQMYGIDKDLLCAIAAQESSGMHKNYSENGHALGLMGIEKIWANAEVEVYNFDNECWEIFRVDYNKVGQDVDYNIKVGSAIFQNRFYENAKSNLVPENELLAYTLQSYNMGLGNTKKLHQTGLHWSDSRNVVKGGDKQYFEHVLSRLDNDTVIDIKQKNGEIFSTNLTNEALKIESKSL